MADPEPRAGEAQSRTSRQSRESARGPEAPAESRVFDRSADAAVRQGADAARDVARTSAEAGRRMTDASVRFADRGVELWRQSMSPLTAFSFEMNRLFDELWRTVPGMTPSMNGAGLMQGLMGMPCSDLHETQDAYHISVELAGMRPEEVEVLQDGDTLVVRGEKRDTHREERGGFRVNERRFGRFERRFHLPRDADRENIQAEFRQGLLEIKAPRHSDRDDGRRRIEVRGDADGGGRARR